MNPTASLWPSANVGVCAQTDPDILTTEETGSTAPPVARTEPWDYVFASLAKRESKTLQFPTEKS